MTAERFLSSRAYGAIELKQSYQRGLLLALLAAALLHVGVIVTLRVYGGPAEVAPKVLPRPRLGDGSVTACPLPKLEKEKDPGGGPPAARQKSDGGTKIVIVDDPAPEWEDAVPTVDELTANVDANAAATRPGWGHDTVGSLDADWVAPLPAFDSFIVLEREPSPLPNQPLPEYPEIARLMEAEGTVQLRVLVSASGDVLEARVLNREGTISHLLVEAALEAVRNWKFIPALQQDRHVAAWLNVPVRFRLRR